MSDDDTFYIATNTVDMIVPSENVMHSVDSYEYNSADYLRYEIDRSEMIAHVFDRQDSNDAKEIVEEHVQRLNELNNALHSIQDAGSLTSESSFLNRYGLSL